MTRNRIRTAIYVALAVLFKINDPFVAFPPLSDFGAASVCFSVHLLREKN